MEIDTGFLIQSITTLYHHAQLRGVVTALRILKQPSRCIRQNDLFSKPCYKCNYITSSLTSEVDSLPAKPFEPVEKCKWFRNFFAFLCYTHRLLKRGYSCGFTGKSAELSIQQPKIISFYCSDSDEVVSTHANGKNLFIFFTPFFTTHFRSCLLRQEIKNHSVLKLG